VHAATPAAVGTDATALTGVTGPPAGLAASGPGAVQSAALAPVAEPLDALLQAFVDERRIEVQGIDPSLTEVVDEIGGLVAAGGKRLRPAFVYWGHRATGAGHEPEVLLPAGAVELLHTFALLHDDVMDRSASRR